MRKPTFPLRMDDGTEARSLEELKEHFSLPKVLDYLKNGTLVTWMRDRNLNDMADQVQELDPENRDSIKQLCRILGFSKEEACRFDRIFLLKRYTTDRTYEDVTDRIAFNQDELLELLNKGEKEIYLCGDKFSIPLDQSGVRSIGINTPTAVIASREKVNWKEKGISFVNTAFDQEYINMTGQKNADAYNSISPDYQPSSRLGRYFDNPDNRQRQKFYALLRNEFLSFHFDPNLCTGNSIDIFKYDKNGDFSDPYYIYNITKNIQCVTKSIQDSINQMVKLTLSLSKGTDNKKSTPFSSSANQTAQAIIDQAFYKKHIPLNLSNFDAEDVALLDEYKMKFNKIMGEYLDDDKVAELEKIIYKEVAIYKKYPGLKLYEIYNAIGYFSELGLDEIDYVKKFIIEPYYGKTTAVQYNKNFSVRGQRFELYVKNLDKYFGGSRCTYKDKILELFIKRKPENKWMEAVFGNAFMQGYDCKNPMVSNMWAYPDITDSVVKSLEGCNSCSLGTPCNVKGHLLFWMLFLAGMDDEYTKNLRTISDAASMFIYDENQLKDWITAAKGALEGKELKDLSYSTIDGRDFFIRKKTFD